MNSTIQVFDCEEVTQLSEDLKCGSQQIGSSITSQMFVAPNSIASIYIDDIHDRELDGKSVFEAPISQPENTPTTSDDLSIKVKEILSIWKLVKGAGQRAPKDWCYTGPCDYPLDGTR
ncbi:hypothetical protein LC612_43130 [Nostoc sp. CHAB 5834]|nr:hypothetical protein [Nostoc sp. CHAB 5834]